MFLGINYRNQKFLKFSCTRISYCRKSQKFPVTKISDWVFSFLSPHVLMHSRLLYIAFCLSVRPSVKKMPGYHISDTVWPRVTKFGKDMDVDDPKVYSEGQGHTSQIKVTDKKKTGIQFLFRHLTGNVEGEGSHGSGSKVTWFKVKGHLGKVSLKVIILTGGLTSMSSCFIMAIYPTPSMI